MKTKISEKNKNLVYQKLDTDISDILSGVVHRWSPKNNALFKKSLASTGLPNPDFRDIVELDRISRVHDLLTVHSLIRARGVVLSQNNAAISKAQQFLSEVLASGTESSFTYYKILLLGLQDAFLFHRELLEGKDSWDKADHLKRYYAEALRFWKKRDRERAVYYLGGALYFVQDAWLGMSNDKEYSKYVEETFEGKRYSEKAETWLNREIPFDEWIRSVEKERGKLNQEMGSLEDLRSNDSITPFLARRAQADGVLLILQFFLEAEESS